MDWKKIFSKKGFVTFIKTAKACVLCASFILLASCTNSNKTDTTVTVPSVLNAGTGLPGFGGGTLPNGSGLTAITLVNVTPSVSDNNGTTLDVIGQNGEIALYCPDTTSCSCRFRYSDPVTSTSLDANSPVTYMETNMLRCSYASVASGVASFGVSLIVSQGNLSSNEVQMKFPDIAAAKQTDNENNYSLVTRYQCKDIIQTQGNGVSNFYQGLEDPQVWFLGLSYNLYTTSLGQDYGSGDAAHECPSRVTDESVVKYSQGRYWPDLANNHSSPSCPAAPAPCVAGPAGLDPLCGTEVGNPDCPGLASSSFTGRSGMFNSGLGEYNSRSSIFGNAGDIFATGSSVDGTTENEPYDMALYSAKPLTGHDNVIYPVEVDKGTKTSVGVRNGNNCTTGVDASTCTCITGKEKGCRKYQINRHDFYVANFQDTTFRVPLCTAHSVGGTTGARNLTTPLQCDPAQTPNDVIGYGAYPNAAGQCPNTALPTGKKWGLLWKFRYNFSPRRMISIANPNDVGSLFCTEQSKECASSTGAGVRSCNTTANNCAAVGALDGVQYCTNSNTTTVDSVNWNLGSVQNFSNKGSRFGNCLDVAENRDPAAAAQNGWCAKVDGSAPFFVRSVAPPGNTQYSFSLTWDTSTTILQQGCFDPMQLYFQNSLWSNALTGLLNVMVSSTFGCNSWDDTTTNRNRGFNTNAPATATLGRHTFDWQGFPFISGNYYSKDADAPDELRGVGYGGNYCNPTLPGSRWSGTPDTTYTPPGAGQLAQLGVNYVGWDDGKDVWLMGNGSRSACIEADIDNDVGFLYNPTARITPTIYNPISTVGDGALNDLWLRLPGDEVATIGNAAATGLDNLAADQGMGYVGKVSSFPKTIKNWFDFVGIGCPGRCDNSDENNSYPSLDKWSPGKTYQAGLSAGTPVADNATRSGPHSSTDSWGGYGIFQFSTNIVEQNGPEDIVYVASPTGITMGMMEGDLDLQAQYRPVRYVRGVRADYQLVTDSTNTTDPNSRLPHFPLCVLQDNGD